MLIPWRRKAEFQQNMFIKSVEKETVKGLESTLQNRIKIPKDHNRLGRYSYPKDDKVLYLAIKCQVFSYTMGKIWDNVCKNILGGSVKSFMSQFLMHAGKAYTNLVWICQESYTSHSTPEIWN